MVNRYWLLVIGYLLSGVRCQVSGVRCQATDHNPLCTKNFLLENWKFEIGTSFGIKI